MASTKGMDATLKLPLNSMGFTITELLVATAISFITLTVTGQALISHLETTQTAEAVERQRNDWARTSKFIESEISLSERLITDFDNVSIPNDCSLDRSEFRIALDIRRDLPTVIYAVKSSDRTGLWITLCGVVDQALMTTVLTTTQSTGH